MFNLSFRHCLHRLRTEPFCRFKLFVAAALLVLALGNAAALGQIQATNHRECVDRNMRAANARPALQQLVEANIADGSPHSAAVWQHYLDLTAANPNPGC